MSKIRSKGATSRASEVSNAPVMDEPTRMILDGHSMVVHHHAQRAARERQAPDMLDDRRDLERSERQRQARIAPVSCGGPGERA